MRCKKKTNKTKDKSKLNNFSIKFFEKGNVQYYVGMPSANIKIEETEAMLILQSFRGGNSIIHPKDPGVLFLKGM